ncbi:hypothetical protein J437_LFUL004311 [Ladona fulva]|uniref:Methionine--tRNA ligase, cytoplasmic n=1 Tax=Ladona fulva TaxID=123851 RepID=A0A8K0JYX3_LADFU|nr:hypothetical protein J437_LFUL004311 [Ladona fulva]
MKILGSSYNSATLKLLLASKVSNVELDVLTTGPKHVLYKGQPMLELDSRVRIYSANSGVWYLFRKKFGHQLQDYDSAIDHWMEWEMMHLQPAGDNFHPLSSEKRQKELGTISKLEETLKKCNFIAGTNDVTAADICIWSSIHFMQIDQKDLLTTFPSVKAWYERLLSLKAFQEAVEKSSALNVAGTGTETVGKAKTQNTRAEVKKQATSSVSSERVPNTVENDSPEPRSATEDEITSAVQNWKLGQQNSPSPRILKHPVLPVEGTKNVFITSALPYVNNVPHLGNIIGCVLSADVFARFCRLRGYNTLYISGTDEYGTATETKALEEGVTPQEICDRYHEIHAQVYKWFNISFDHFGRTSTIQHAAICQQIFSDVHKNGYTFTDSVEQLYCNNCRRFLADRFVEGICPLCNYPDARGDQCDSCGRLVNANELKSPRCKLCGSTPSPKSSTHLFLDLPKIEPKLRIWLDTVVDGWSNNAQVIARSWVKDGLKPRCITRDLKWGIPVPVEGFTNKVFYVWFDAPIGYMSILNCYTNEWEKWWKPQNSVEVKYFQFMAKDNVPFHSIIFPSCLLAVGKYLNYEEGKFSKSRGVGVFGSEAESTGIPSDIWRFYLLWVRPENQDSAFVWNDLAQRNNSELLNNLGNFALRALTFLEKNFDGKIPEVNVDGEFERSLVGAVNKELKDYLSVMENARSLREGLRRLLAISRHGNLLMQSSQPWVLIKGGPEDRQG